MIKPIYQSNGEVVAVVHRGQLYTRDGDWIGILRGAQVFDPLGRYLGTLSEDRRLLRDNRSPDPISISPPASPSRLRSIPDLFPLAPTFAQLTFNLVDVFEDDPGRFDHFVELRPDMD